MVEVPLLQRGHGEPVQGAGVRPEAQPERHRGDRRDRNEAAQQKYEMFLTELSDLVENHPPVRVRERLRTKPEQVANLDFGPAHVRVLFSLREDYLANLEAYSELQSIVWSS